MLVNGVDISTCNAKFFNITPAARTVTNATEILDGASIPVMMPPAFGTKEYTLKLNVYGEGRKEIWENASRLLQLFSEVVDVSISGFSDNGNQRFFKLSLTKVSQGLWHQTDGDRKLHLIRGFGVSERKCVCGSWWL